MLKDMWELANTPSRGGNSARRIFSFVLTVFIAAFLWVLFTSPALHAADDLVHFTGNNLTYQGNQYVDAGKATAGNSAGIPVGSEYFTFSEPVSVGVPTQQTDIIYFAAGKTPTKETSATFASYDTDTSRAPPVYSNPSTKKTLTVDTTLQGTDGGTNCAIQGIGWIVCPISNALAGGMDWFMGALGNFVKVQPLNVTDTHNDLYVAWNIMRSIANVAFIIVFLIIIYSQLTSFGVSNYGLKKLLPRLIVGAVIVNLSYFMCAAILDASNVLGSSIQDLLISMRTTVFNATGSNASVANGDFTNFTTSALAGGTVAAGTVVGGIALNSALIGGSFVGLWYLLIPALLALLLAIMVVVLILAARQALIIILIVISPLAFVAYLLPNTEKWFKQWQKTFTTMMVFYPAFSVVLGGSQLASAVIIKNASSLTVVALGLIVQVAPLAITPWLLKLSGGTIQSIAKFAQGQNKRINGAVSGWAKPRREIARDNALGTASRSPLRRNAQYWSARGRRVKERGEVASMRADNFYKARNPDSANWHNGIAMQRRTAEEQKEIQGERESKQWTNHVLTNAHAQQQDLELRSLKDQVAGNKAQLDARYDIRKAANFKLTDEYKKHMSAEARTLVDNAQMATEQIATHGMASSIAKRNQTQDFAKTLKTNVAVRNIAGAITIDEQGAESALASAINSVNEAYSKSTAEARTILNSFNLSSIEKQNLAMGRLNEDGSPIVGEDDDGNFYDFKLTNNYTHEAAIEDQLAAGGVRDAEELVVASGDKLNKYRKTIAEGILKNAGLREKAFYLSGETLDDIKAGKIQTEKDLDVVATRAIINGKIGEAQLAALDPLSAKRLARAAVDRKTTGPHVGTLRVTDAGKIEEAVQRLATTAADTFVGDKKSNILGASRTELGNIARIKDTTFNLDATPPNNNTTPPPNP